MAKSRDLRRENKFCGLQDLLDAINSIGGVSNKNHLVDNETFTIVKGSQHKVCYEFTTDPNTKLEIEEKADLVVENGYIYNLGTICNFGTIYSL